MTQPYKGHCQLVRGMILLYKCCCQPVREAWLGLTNITVSLWEMYDSAFINITVSLWEACFSLTNVTVSLWEMYDSALQKSLSVCESGMTQPYKSHCPFVRVAWLSLTKVTVRLWEWHDSALQKSLSVCESGMTQPYKSHCLFVRVAWLSLTKITGIIDEDDLMDEVGRRPLQDSMDSSQEGWECFIVETDDDAGSGQVRFICLPVTSAHTHRNRWWCWQWASQIHIYIFMSYCATCRNKLSTQT